MVEPAQIKNFCEGDLSETKGPVAALLVETKDYISRIDNGLQLSVNKHMCKDTCPCPVIDITKWETTMQVELSKDDGVYVINEVGGYTSFE